MIPGLSPIVGGITYRPAILTASGIYGTFTETQDYTNAPIGTASPTRYVVVGVLWSNTDNSSLTITVGGATPTQLATYSLADIRFVRFFGITVASGTTVTVSTSASNAGQRLIGVFAIDHLNSSTPTASVFDDGAPIDLTLNVAAYGVAIAIAQTSTADGTWSGMTEAFDTHPGGGYGSGAVFEADASGNTPLVASATAGAGGVYFGGALAFR